MTRVLKSYLLPYCDIGQNQVKRIYEKVSIVAKKIFYSFYNNKKMIVSGIYSCLLMQKGVQATTFIQTGENQYVSCENMLCSQWIATGLDHQLFSPIIPFRCDPSHPYYAPFPFEDKCMNTLCDYQNRVGRKLPECETFNNFSSDRLNLFWRELCPNKQSSQKDLMEFCSTGKCTENDIFTITIDETLQGLCSNNRIKELVHLIHHAIAKGKTMRLETGEWNTKDLLLELLNRVTTVISSTSVQLKKILNIKKIIDPIVMENEILYNLRNPIQKLLDVIIDPIKYAVTDLESNPYFSTSFENSLLKVTDKLKNLFVYNITKGELGNSIDQFVDYPGDKTIELIKYSKEAYDAPSLPVLSNGAPALKGKQYELLVYSIKNWNNSYCFYSRPNMILCRLPLPSSTAQINRIFRRLRNFYTKHVYCHFIDDDYWCNFGKFLKKLCNNRNVTKIGKCFWDHIILELKITADNDYQINLVGDCYHEIFTVKKC